VGLSQTRGLSRHADSDCRSGSALYLDARKILASNRRLHRLMRETIAKAWAECESARAEN
jgi:hypothetical protein